MTIQTKSHQAKNKQAIIHRAPWVVADTSAEIYTNTTDIIEDGAVVVSNGFIKTVGKFGEIRKEFSSLPIKEHESKVLAPALINSHCHLELSYLNLTEYCGNQTFYSNDFTLWIRELLKSRHKESDS